MTSGRRAKQRRRAQQGGMYALDVWGVLGAIIRRELTPDAELVAAALIGRTGVLHTVPRLQPGEVLTAIRELHAEGRLAVGDDGRAYRTPKGRPCCDHCNNREGDPAGHDYGDEAAHDGPCPECSMDEYLAAEARRSGEE